MLHVYPHAGVPCFSNQFDDDRVTYADKFRDSDGLTTKQGRFWCDSLCIELSYSSFSGTDLGLCRNVCCALKLRQDFPAEPLNVFPNCARRNRQRAGTNAHALQTGELLLNLAEFFVHVRR